MRLLPAPARGAGRVRDARGALLGHSFVLQRLVLLLVLDVRSFVGHEDPLLGTEHGSHTPAAARETITPLGRRLRRCSSPERVNSAGSHSYGGSGRSAACAESAGRKLRKPPAEGTGRDGEEAQTWYGDRGARRGPGDFRRGSCGSRAQGESRQHAGELGRSQLGGSQLGRALAVGSS